MTLLWVLNISNHPLLLVNPFLMVSHLPNPLLPHLCIMLLDDGLAVFSHLAETLLLHLIGLPLQFNLI